MARDEQLVTLKPTAVGRFGSNTLAHAPRVSVDAARDLIAAVGRSPETPDLWAEAGERFSPARVALGVAVICDQDEEDPGVRLVISLLISDRVPAGEKEVIPELGPAGTTPAEVDFDDLLKATNAALGGAHAFRYTGHFHLSPDEAGLKFPLPMTLWRENRPFGSMVGARFALDLRGTRDGWIAMDTDGDEDTLISWSFSRNTKLEEGMVISTWQQIRQLYDRAIIAKGS